MKVRNAEAYTPAVRSFIPMLYVAWADGLLSPSEVQIIHAEIGKLSHLSQAERTLLLRWSDPSEWPSEEVFKSWMQMLKETGRNVDYQSLDSIVELGLEMSSRASGGMSIEAQQATRQALAELEEALELTGLARFRAIGYHRSDDQQPPQAVETQGLSQLLEGDNREVKDRLKKLLSDPIFAIKPFRDKGVYRAKVLEWVKHLAQHGYGALGFPKEFGGQNSMMRYAAVFEVLSLHDLSLAVKFGVQFGLFGGSVQNLGTAKHHQQYLTDTGTAKLLGCFAMTETGHGSNVRDLETTATYDPNADEIIIHSPSRAAGKEYIGNAFHAHMATVFAQLQVGDEACGVHAVLVPLRDDAGNLLPGIEVEDCGYKMGLNGVDNGRIWFDQVRVPRVNLLDRFGQIDEAGIYHSPIKNPSKRFFTMLGTLVAGRICVGMGALSAAKASLAIAIKYGLRRRQFGADKGSLETLILDYPTHQRRLLIPLSRAYALHFASQYLVHRYESRNEEDGREIETLAAGVKSYTTWFATRTIQECREACGGKGYLWENRIPSYKADADIFATFEGDNTVLMQLVAKGLLSSFKEEFSGGGFMAAIRYLGSQVGDSMTQINPIYKRKTDAVHLQDLRFHKHAFEFRERKILFALGSRMRTMFKKRITPYDVFLRTQSHMMALAHAYIERVVLEQFQAIIQDEEQTERPEHLRDLYLLFALSTIESNKGWYLEHDYMEGVKTKAIRRRVDLLCGRIRPHANELVDAFGIPRGSLLAPIALG